MSRFTVIDCLEGSTLQDTENGQPMHSAIGPTREAEQIYLQPGKLSTRLSLSSQASRPFVLWDVGMGIAGNAAAAIAAFKADFHLSVEQQFANGLVLARQAIDSGAATALVERWSKLSHEIAEKFPA